MKAPMNFYLIMPKLPPWGMIEWQILKKCGAHGYKYLYLISLAFNYSDWLDIEITPKGLGELHVYHSFLCCIALVWFGLVWSGLSVPENYVKSRILNCTKKMDCSGIHLQNHIYKLKSNADSFALHVIQSKYFRIYYKCKIFSFYRCKIHSVC